jgi:hydroxypyruvate isomerase
MIKNEDLSRRNILKKMAGTAAVSILGMSLPQRLFAAEQSLEKNLKGKINHSVCRWCYNDIPLEDLCKAANKIGIKSIELIGPDEWPIIKKYGLTCAMPMFAGKGLEYGFNDLSLHDELIESYSDFIPQVADAGLKQIICFSGNRRGLDDKKGIENCVIGLKRLMPIAEKYKIIVSMELLNSRVDHPDYQCDHSAWGISLVDQVGSDYFKLLFDIYHMQIMEGDIIATIKKYHTYFSHYHTGGVPGRHEIDETQEIYYPAIIKAIVETGYTGFVAQEFFAKREDKIASLKQGVLICDV